MMAPCASKSFTSPLPPPSLHKQALWSKHSGQLPKTELTMSGEKWACAFSFDLEQEGYDSRCLGECPSEHLANLQPDTRTPRGQQGGGLSVIRPNTATPSLPNIAGNLERPSHELKQLCTHHLSHRGEQTPVLPIAHQNGVQSEILHPWMEAQGAENDDTCELRPTLDSSPNWGRHRAEHAAIHRMRKL